MMAGEHFHASSAGGKTGGGQRSLPSVSAADQLDALLAKFLDLPPEAQAQAKALVMAETQAMFWVPNPGAQTEAYYSLADQLLYGGEVGGGKTDLLLGLGSQEHKRSLILRRHNKEVDFLADRLEEIVGHRDGYNGQKHTWKLVCGTAKGIIQRLLQFGGCQHLGDERSYKGQPKDFIGFDEASEFLEEMVNFIITWLRSADPNQRCRLVFATNPPTTVDGEWIVRWFAPWLDKKHPLYPYPEGKLLYFKRRPGSKTEFDFFEEEPEPDMLKGVPVRTLTRTFIRSGLANNPDYDRSDYRSRLALLPDALRKSHAEGDFTVSAADDEWQLIPTEWIIVAQERWTEDPPPGVEMTAMGMDVAQGGADTTTLAPRYDQWFAQLIAVPGIETPDGPSAAAVAIKHQRDGAQINVDMGGGWGGSAFDHLKSNGLSVLAFVPSAEGIGRSADGKYTFLNLRAAGYWQLRECLAPGSGYKLALPPDGELKQELAAIRYREMPGAKIKIWEKTEIKKLIGRSPDKADAVMLSWFSGSARIRRRGENRIGRLPTESVNPNRPRHRRHRGHIGISSSSGPSSEQG